MSTDKYDGIDRPKAQLDLDIMVARYRYALRQPDLMRALCDWHEQTIGYRPEVDDPTISRSQVFDGVRDYMHVVAEETGAELPPSEGHEFARVHARLVGTMPDDETEVDPVLVRKADGTFVFLADGVQIDYPLRSSCGRFGVAPTEYGFEMVDTGGGCTAWSRGFFFDGHRVDLLVTSNETGDHRVEAGKAVDMGVYLWDDNGVFMNWTQADETNEETGMYVPAVDVTNSWDEWIANVER